MNYKKLIIFYLSFEVVALLIGYILAIKELKAAPNYIGTIISMAVAVGFGLALYFVYTLVKKRITLNQFLIYFLLSLSGVVIPYLFLMIVVSQIK